MVIYQNMVKYYFTQTVMQFLCEDSIKTRLQAAAIYNFKKFSGGYAPPLGPLWGTVSPVENFIKREGEGEESDVRALRGPA